ncbi:MAG: hypothetical protein JXR62_06420 [Bacilli bacterium]|nr:hypothetical protein [Bacilli bacterium]
MKKTKIFITLFLFILFSIISTKSIFAVEHKVIYFKEATCSVCNLLAGYPDGPAGDYNPDIDYLLIMENQGITVEIHDILESSIESDLFAAYNTSYGITKSEAGVPIVFAGNQYFQGYDDIKNAVNDQTIYSLSATSLNDIVIIEGQIFDDITGIAGFLTVLFAGFLDGFNPCAIAMLLLFVSLLGFSENKRVLILVSITYIFALFISYFLIGTLFLSFLTTYAQQALIINKIISWFVALLCSFLFLFNLYDYFVTKRQDYAKVKNQLPKWVQKYNKKLIKAFTGIINDKENKKGLIAVLALTFILGILLSVTELICTGQIYLGILYGIHYLSNTYAYIALLAYNLMFVLPLIAIAVIAIRGKGVMSTSNFIREHLHIIKLLNALLFLTIAVYYFYRIF